MHQRIDYSSKDEASSDDGWSDWNEVVDQVESDEQEEEPAEEHHVAVRMGRPKKRKSVLDPPVAVYLTPSQLPKKNGSRSELAVFEGEVYQRAGQPNEEGIQQWRCVKKAYGCKSVIETDRRNNCIAKSEGGHSHVTPMVDLDLRAFKAQIPVLALQDQSALREIHSRLVEHSSDELRVRVDVLNTASVINYHRKKRDADPRTTTNPEQMIIPADLRNYKDTPFIIFDSEPSDRRIIIFSTPALMEFLQNSEWWGFDGTFDLVPTGRKQLLTLHAKQGESFVPCLHALLPKKSRRTYDRLCLCRHSAVDTEYKMVKKHGCFAHFSRALYRRVQKLGLVRRYKEGGAFKTLFNMLKSLAYVPVHNLSDAFNLVMLKCTRNAERTPIFEEGISEMRFVEYFQQIWIGRPGGARPMFSNELWNCFELTKAGNSKTTNSLEAWHNALKLALGSSDGKKPKF